MNKRFTFLSLMIGLFVCVTVFSACSKDNDNNDPSNPLVGTWRAEVEEKGELQYWEVTFNKNFTWSTIEYNKYDSSIIHRIATGTYEIIAENYIRTISDVEHEVWTSEFKITDGNKLILSAEGEGLIWYKIK